MRLEFAVEGFDVAYKDAGPLLQAHYEEIAQARDIIKLDPDLNHYRAQERAKKLEVHTARFDGELVGYSVWLIGPHLHYKESLTAKSDVLFVDKRFRAGMLGVKFIKYTTEQIALRGVQRILMNTKKLHDFGMLLERQGFEPLETIYSKVIRHNGETTREHTVS